MDRREARLQTWCRTGGPRRPGRGLGDTDDDVVDPILRHALSEYGLRQRLLSGSRASPFRRCAKLRR